MPRDSGYVVLIYVGFYVTGSFSSFCREVVSYHRNPLDIYGCSHVVILYGIVLDLEV